MIHKIKHIKGMVAFTLQTTEAAEKFLSEVKLVKCAASLGSSHSLACQPAKLTHVMCTPQASSDTENTWNETVIIQEREAAGVTDGLVRLSVGLENVQDIIEDLTQALDKCTQ